jgi:hypothetical protein
MKPAAFWSERLRAHGHTGWADRVIYAGDQLERLERVRVVLLELSARGGKAPDFDWVLASSCGCWSSSASPFAATILS